MQTTPGVQDVNLIPVWTGNTFKKWNMSMGKGGPVYGPGGYPHIQIGNPSGSTIKFTIVDPKGVEFNSANPIYVRAGTAKPGHEVDPQFTYSLSADTHNNLNVVLTLHDSNTTAGPYNYVLYFNDADPFDPIIDNTGPHGGMGGGNSSSTYAWYAVGAVALIAVAVLAFRLMRSR
jgi:hypothetical protein